MQVDAEILTAHTKAAITYRSEFHRGCREGVFELRLDFGPGYRVYYGRDGKTLIILLGGGDKRRQMGDIAAAVARWQRYKQTK